MRYAQCWHRIINQTITIHRFNKLSYAVAFIEYNGLKFCVKIWVYAFLHFFFARHHWVKQYKRVFNLIRNISYFKIYVRHVPIQSLAIFESVYRDYELYLKTAENSIYQLFSIHIFLKTDILAIN